MSLLKYIQTSKGTGRLSARIAAMVLCAAMTAGCGAAATDAAKTAADTAAQDASGTAKDAGSKEPAAQDASAADEEEPELVDPVGTVLRYENVSFRDISRVTSWQGVVCPETTEYAYESQRPFGNYGALPGDSVQAGDLLFYGEADSSADEIEEIEDENTELLEEHTAYCADMTADIAKAKKEEFEAAQDYQDMCADAPDEDSPWYSGWAKGVMPVERRAKQTKAAREKLEQALKENQEQFDLKYAYNEKRIARLESEKQSSNVNSTVDGYVVASAFHLPGDDVPEGTSIVAVGDPTKKVIMCEYVSKNIVNKAVDLYAIIDGERYEVQYELMEPDEYRRKKQKDGDVYTKFHIADPDDKVELGEYAVVVIVEEMKTNVLCVPRGAVNKDERGSYVYMYDNGESVYTPVQTGIFDTGFIEITSGLKEGDPVVYDAPYTVGTKTITLERGEVGTDFSTDGYLFYPSAEWLTNPAKNSTCYLNELLVNRYELVEEGQLLARLEIVADDIEIARIKRKIQRQNERLADLNAKKKETYNKDELETLDRSIRDRNRAIASLNKQLEKLTRYSGMYDIVSPVKGIVTDITYRKAGELLNTKERLVQISRDDSSYIIVEDKGAMLSYGDVAEVVAKNGSATRGESAEGKVVSLNSWGLSGSMRLGYTLVKVPQEDMIRMTEAGGASNDNGYWSRSRFGVSLVSRRMTNVVLVPKSAVYNSGNDTYVVAKNADGSTRLIKFVAGGSDNSNYWVAYGDVTEGMEICSE